jgi:hypothetical protein
VQHAVIGADNDLLITITVKIGRGRRSVDDSFAA